MASKAATPAPPIDRTLMLHSYSVYLLSLLRPFNERGPSIDMSEVSRAEAISQFKLGIAKTGQMGKTRQNMKKTALASLYAFGIAACSGNSPSTADVEKALKADFQDCPNLSVEHVKLVNGLSVDDRTHQVEAQFDLKILPLPRDVVDDAKKAIAQMQAESQEIERRREEIKKQEDQIYAQMGQLNSNPQGDQALANQEARKLQQDLYDLESKKSDLYKLSTAKPVDLREVWGSQACRNREGVNWPAPGTAEMDVFENGQVNSLSITFNMVKTDNGWMKAE